MKRILIARFLVLAARSDDSERPSPAVGGGGAAGGSGAEAAGGPGAGMVFAGPLPDDAQPRKGDSGSPLLAFEGGTPVVHGVLSEGAAFDDYNFGAIYTQPPDDLRAWAQGVVRCVEGATAEACAGGEVAARSGAGAEREAVRAFRRAGARLA
jgi:hypothetical protein